MSTFSDNLGFPEHLAALVHDLERERKALTEMKGTERTKTLLALARSSTDVGQELRAWDRKLDEESEQLTDSERLQDMRTWLLTLPGALRKQFYRDCAMDELAKPSSAIRLTVELVEVH